MTKETRKRLGKLWKEGKVDGDFEAYYLEFKTEIDSSPISDELPVFLFNIG